MRINRVKKRHGKLPLGSMKKSVVLLLIIAVAVISYFAINSIRAVTLLPIEKITFAGNRHLTDEELRSFSGVHIKDSLVALSGHAVGRQLLKSPWVRSVTVLKEYPETLSVVIKEAEPFALLDTEGHLFLVDERGKILDELRDDSVPFLPIITGDPAKEKEGFAEALSLAKAMNETGFAAERNQIEIIGSRPEELEAVIDGTHVKIGAGDYEQKLERLLPLEEEVRKRGIPVEYIDLRFANRAVVKPIADTVVR
ncbi:MAG: FtsQ-type POTRA domain-containing protein [Nitrospirota bacterium]